MRSLALSTFLAAFPAALLLAPAASAAPAQGPSAKFLPSTAAIPGEYIVVLKQAPSSTMVASQVAALDAQIDSLAIKHSAKVGNRYTAALVGFAGKMTEADALALSEDPSVAYVEENGRVQASAVTTQPGATWGLDRVDQASLPLDTKFNQLGQGEGATIFVIDTGILATHTDFGARVALPGYTAIQDGRGSTDCNGHGTHVAGTTAGTAWGIAKKATLIPVRVLDCAGSGSNEGVIAGINYVAQRNLPRAVANMSLGGAASAAVDQAVAGAYTAGVVMAVAAGNDNLDACNYSPARAPVAITVGATAIDDSRSTFSNYGTCVDISAPGTNITSAWITNNTSTNTISGTSMASPHVAGAIAAYRAANPTATPAQVATAITGKAITGKITNVTGSPNLLLNARFVDITAPTAAIMSPSDGASVGANFTVSVMSEDVNLVAVELSVDGAVVETKTSGPFEFSVSGLQKGSHTISITSKDFAELSTTKTATVTVTGSGTGNNGGDGTGGGGGTGGGDGGADGSSDELTGGCSTSGSAGGPLLLLLGLLAFARRRNR